MRVAVLLRREAVVRVVVARAVVRVGRHGLSISGSDRWVVCVDDVPVAQLL